MIINEPKLVEILSARSLDRSKFWLRAAGVEVTKKEKSLRGSSKSYAYSNPINKKTMRSFISSDRDAQLITRTQKSANNPSYVAKPNLFIEGIPFTISSRNSDVDPTNPNSLFRKMMYYERFQWQMGVLELERAGYFFETKTADSDEYLITAKLVTFKKDEDRITILENIVDNFTDSLAAFKRDREISIDDYSQQHIELINGLDDTLEIDSVEEVEIPILNPSELADSLIDKYVITPTIKIDWSTI